MRSWVHPASRRRYSVPTSRPTDERHGRDSAAGAPLHACTHDDDALRACTLRSRLRRPPIRRPWCSRGQQRPNSVKNGTYGVVPGRTVTDETPQTDSARAVCVFRALGDLALAVQPRTCAIDIQIGSGCAHCWRAERRRIAYGRASRASLDTDKVSALRIRRKIGLTYPYQPAYSMSWGCATARTAHTARAGAARARCSVAPAVIWNGCAPRGVHAPLPAPARWRSSRVLASPGRRVRRAKWSAEW